MEVSEKKFVQDYLNFTRVLRSQLKLVQILERKFFELDDLCEWAIRNDVTCLDDKSGERVSIVDESLSKEQVAVYDRMLKEVATLHDMLINGRKCFVM